MHQWRANAVIQGSIPDFNFIIRLVKLKRHFLDILIQSIKFTIQFAIAFNSPPQRVTASAPKFEDSLAERAADAPPPKV